MMPLVLEHQQPAAQLRHLAQHRSGRGFGQSITEMHEPIGTTLEPMTKNNDVNG